MFNFTETGLSIGQVMLLLDEQLSVQGLITQLVNADQDAEIYFTFADAKCDRGYYSQVNIITGSGISTADELLGFVRDIVDTNVKNEKGITLGVDLDTLVTLNGAPLTRRLLAILDECYSS